MEEPSDDEIVKELLHTFETYPGNVDRLRFIYESIRRRRPRWQLTLKVSRRLSIAILW